MDKNNNDHNEWTKMEKVPVEYKSIYSVWQIGENRLLLAPRFHDNHHFIAMFIPSLNKWRKKKAYFVRLQTQTISIINENKSLLVFNQNKYANNWKKYEFQSYQSHNDEQFEIEFDDDNNKSNQFDTKNYNNMKLWYHNPSRKLILFYFQLHINKVYTYYYNEETEQFIKLCSENEFYVIFKNQNIDQLKLYPFKSSRHQILIVTPKDYAVIDNIGVAGKQPKVSSYINRSPLNGDICGISYDYNPATNELIYSLTNRQIGIVKFTTNRNSTNTKCYDIVQRYSSIKLPSENHYKIKIRQNNKTQTMLIAGYCKQTIQYNVPIVLKQIIKKYVAWNAFVHIFENSKQNHWMLPLIEILQQ